MPSIGEFFVELGVDTSAGQVTVKDLISSFGELEASTLGEIGALSTLAAGLGELAEHGMEVAESFRSFQSQTGLSITGLERWQRVAQQVGVDSNTVAGSVKTLQQNLVDISLGRGNISPYQLLGITPQSVGYDAFKVLDQLRGRSKMFSPAFFAKQLSAMGIDPSMINTLKLTRDEFEKLANVSKGMTDQQAVGFLQMKQDISQVKLQMADFGYTAGLWIKPLIDDLAAVVNYLHESPRALALVSAGLVGVGIAAAAAFAPWLLTGLAISAVLAGIILILDDIISYFRTGKSAGADFGDALAKMFGKLGTKAEDWLWEHNLIPNSGPVLGAAAAGGGGNVNKTINNSIVVHDASGRPHEAVASEYRRAIDNADKQIQ